MLWYLPPNPSSVYCHFFTWTLLIKPPELLAILKHIEYILHINTEGVPTVQRALLSVPSSKLNWIFTVAIFINRIGMGFLYAPITSVYFLLLYSGLRHRHWHRLPLFKYWLWYYLYASKLITLLFLWPTFLIYKIRIILKESPFWFVIRNMS